MFSGKNPVVFTGFFTGFIYRVYYRVFTGFLPGFSDYRVFLTGFLRLPGFITGFFTGFFTGFLRIPEPGSFTGFFYRVFLPGFFTGFITDDPCPVRGASKTPRKPLGLSMISTMGA